MYKIEDLTKDISLKFLRHYKLISINSDLACSDVQLYYGSPGVLGATSVNLLVFNYLLLHQQKAHISTVWEEILQQDGYGIETSVKSLISDWVDWGEAEFGEEFNAIYHSFSSLSAKDLLIIRDSITKIKSIGSALHNLYEDGV